MSLIDKTCASLRILFLLKPEERTIYEGTKLKDEVSKELTAIPLSEIWECLTHPDGLSVVASS